MARQVIMAGVDVSQYVLSVTDVVPEAGDYGQVLSTTIPQLTGLAELFDPGNPESPFYGMLDVRDMPIQILNRGVQTFSGSVLSLTTDGAGRSVAVALRTEIQRTLEGGLIYISPEDQTPAAAFRAICDVYGIAYNVDSINRAEAVYGPNNVYVRVRNPLPDMTILDGFQRLCEIGVARIYGLDGELYMDAWSDNSADTGSLLTVSDALAADYPLLSRPSSERLNKQKMDGYVVEWIGDVEGSNTRLSGSNMRTISGSQDQPVRIQTRKAAVWIGEQWLAYLNRAQDRITFKIPVDVARSIPLNAPLTLSYSQWGADRIVDITRIQASGLVSGELTGISR